MRKVSKFEESVNKHIAELKDSMTGYTSWNDDTTSQNYYTKKEFCKELETISLKINGLAHKQWLTETEKYNKAVAKVKAIDSKRINKQLKDGRN